jgi:NAD(P)-dependent dehydrogenase (short-subunit alcohol dehydrogenase family)
MRFTNQVAFVTGGSSGIGRAAAERLAREGAQIALMAREHDELEETRSSIERESQREVLTLAGDIAREADVRQAIADIRSRFGRLDVVVANAGINGVWAPLEKLDVDEWQHTLNVNLTGTYITIREAVALMEENAGGSIVVTSSINGTRTFSISGATAYSTSKAGQVAMTQMLALELAPRNIRVNVVCPGKTATDIGERTEDQGTAEVTYPVEFPQGKVPLTQGRAGRPEQVASAIAYLASDEADFITGSPLWIDGAQSLVMG